MKYVIELKVRKHGLCHSIWQQLFGAVHCRDIESHKSEIILENEIKELIDEFFNPPERKIK